MSKEECRKLVRDIFGEEAASDEDIVSWYMEVNNVALDETYNQAIDDAIEESEKYKEVAYNEFQIAAFNFLELLKSKLQSLKK